MHPLLMTIPGDGLTFGAPGWFWALLLIASLVWFYVDAARRREALLTRIVAQKLQKQLTGQVSHLKRNLRTAFLLGAAALTVVGLAKPRLGFREESFTTKGRDVIIAIDTSRSMLATDTAPTRLGRAKLIAQDLLDLLRGDRTGLIAFAGSAFLQAPLTMDKGAVLNSIQDLDTGTIPKGGTDIAAAIRMAMEAFGKGEGATRALVIMTDGEDLEASAVDAAREAEAAGIRIFTIGFGSASGSLIPIRTDQGRNDFVRDENGRPVNSKLDETRLAEVAKATGGFYIPCGQDAAKVVFDKGILPLEAQVGEVLSSRKPIERYAWPVSAALFLLVLRSLLGEGRRLPGRGLKGLFLLTLLLGAGQQIHASGLSDYNQGNYQGALADFEKRLKAGATAEEIRFDAGAAAYKAGDFKKAAEYFSGAMTSPKPNIRENATYNLANSLVRSGEAAKEKETKLADWKNALQHYETVIKADAKNIKAKENRDIVKKLIEDLKKEQQQKDQKKDQKDNKDQKNDQKNDKSQSDQSQGGGGGQKDSKDNKDQKDSKNQGDKNQPQDQQKNQDKNQDKSQQGNQSGQPSPTPTPSPSPDQGKGDSSKKDQNQQGGQPTPTPSPSASPDQGKGNDSRDENGKKQDQKQDQQENGGDQNRQQSSQGQRARPTPTPSAPKTGGQLNGGQQGDQKDKQKGQAAEAEESKDGQMTASQARALLNSLKDEEAHVTEQQKNRAVEQPLRDW
jgi:Ca-activated chloride channel family protein